MAALALAPREREGPAGDVARVAGAPGRCGAGCTILGAGTPAPVMSVVHSEGHVFPQPISPIIAAFFRDHLRHR